MPERLLRSRLREHGIFTDEGVALVVLEPTGAISVAHDGEAGEASSDADAPA